MKHVSTTLRLSLAGALVAVTAATASAQTTSSGNLTTATTTTTTTGKRKPPTSASAEMINEAIQRSEARAAKERTSGVPQKWGSEEPFTYNPTIRRFNANQQ